MLLHRDLDKASYHFVYIGRTPPKLGICDVSGIDVGEKKQKYMYTLLSSISASSPNIRVKIQVKLFTMFNLINLHIKCNKASNIDGILVHY